MHENTIQKLTDTVHVIRKENMRIAGAIADIDNARDRAITRSVVFSAFKNIGESLQDVHRASLKDRAQERADLVEIVKSLRDSAAACQAENAWDALLTVLDVGIAMIDDHQEQRKKHPLGILDQEDG